MRAGRPLWACTLCLALLLLPCTGSGAATPPSKLVEWPLHIAAEARAAAGGKVSGQAAAVNAPEEKAGYVSTDGSRKIFYYYFGARNASGQAVAGAPLLVWMNGEAAALRPRRHQRAARLPRPAHAAPAAAGCVKVQGAPGAPASLDCFLKTGPTQST